MTDFLKNLLQKRDLKNKKEIENFLYPKWEDIFNPFLFVDMEKAVFRIWQAVEQQEKIVVFSDYDVDGISGGAILAEFFKKIKYKNFENFIPNRNTDGYGFSEKAAKKILELKPKLVITVDCGITDILGANILKKNKIDLIITDHHLPNGKLPGALAIIDHKKEGEKYPEQILAGAGIAFKLVQALLSEKGLEIKNKIKDKNKNFKLNIPLGWEKWLLDLVALATIADMVPLIGENRILVKYGKIVLDKTPRPGLKKIIEKARLNKKDIKTADIGFMIGPRLNAAARLEDPQIAFQALAGETEKAILAAEELERINNRRKYLIAKIMKEVWQKIKERDLQEVIVIGNKEWPLGILGLIAGKIADKYQRPVFVWGGEQLKGSCRSGGKYSIFSLMNKTAQEFVKFGGHAQSGGFEILFDKIHTLEKKLIQNLKQTELIVVKEVEIDAEINIDDVHMDNYQIIEKLEPFGIDNQEPTFLIKKLKIFKVNYFGKNKEHLELIFKNSNNFNIKAISFYYHDKITKKLIDKQKINLICSFELNTWNNNSSLRLKIVKIFS